ncbi:MAG: hypothetical protein M3374_06090 [Pseudomonadota bacterium]|nr:hypothetical protein [Pseudomonadota bacterium]
MSAEHNLPIETISDDELVERLFHLATTGQLENSELGQLDDAVHDRLVQAYGETQPCTDTPTASTTVVNPAIRPQLVAI